MSLYFNEYKNFWILEYLELQDQLKIAETSHFSSPDDRKFQEINIRDQAKTFQEFEQTVHDEYQQTVKEYQRILGKKAWWHFWK